ncbi:MAG: hypothetical protein RR426_09795 [Oscillospiraceae bacterium]
MNHSRAPLALMEQVLMVLVFALAAALCVQVFVFADGRSATHENQDFAVREAQTAAETVKHCHGDLERAAALLGGTLSGDSLTVAYDQNWEKTEGAGVYTAVITREIAQRELLGYATVTVTYGKKESYTLTAAWQEGTEHA